MNRGCSVSLDAVQKNCCLGWMNLAVYQGHVKHLSTSKLLSLLPYTLHRLQINKSTDILLLWIFIDRRGKKSPSKCTEKCFMNVMKKITCFANSSRELILRLPPRPRSKLTINCPRSVQPRRWESPFITVPTKLVSTTKSFCKLQVRVYLIICLIINAMYC